MRIAPPIVRGLRLSILEGASWSIFWGIVAGAIFNALLLLLGAGPVQIAYFNALPLLSQVFGLFAARLLQGRDIRKPMVMWAEAVSRGLYALVPLVLLLPEAGSARVLFVLAVATVSNIVHSAGNVGWLSWTSDLVPEEIRGLYFGVRNAIIGIIGVVGVTVASLWPDAVERAHGRGAEYRTALLVLVGAAVVFAAGSWIGLLFQPVRRMKRLAADGWKGIWDALASPAGRRFAALWATMAFATGMTAGIYTPFFLDRLRISLTGMSIYGFVFWGTSTLVTPLMGRFSDRYGYRRLLIVAWVGVFWQPLVSVMTPNDMPHLFGIAPWTILFDAVAGGCFWPAFGVAQTNLVIAQTRSEERAGLFAILSALAGLVGFLSALLGGQIASVAGRGWSSAILGLPLDDLRLPLVLGATLRLLAGLFILSIHEPPRVRAPVTSSQAFSTVWRVISGKPFPAPPR